MIGFETGKGKIVTHSFLRPDYFGGLLWVGLCQRRWGGRTMAAV